VVVLLLVVMAEVVALPTLLSDGKPIQSEPVVDMAEKTQVADGIMLSMHKTQDEKPSTEVYRVESPKEPNQLSAITLPIPKPDSSLKLKTDASGLAKAVDIITVSKDSAQHASTTRKETVPAASLSLSPEIPDVIFAIPSMRRWKSDGAPAPENYLKPLVDGIWNSASPEHRPHVHFLLYNVDKKPEEHGELLSLRERPNVEILTKSANTDLAKSMAKTSDGKVSYTKYGNTKELSVGTVDWIAGETADGPYLMKEAAKRAPYVVFLEDDVKPTSNVVPKLYDYLTKLKSFGNNDWFMVDLYTPDIYWGPREAHNMDRYDFECCTQAMMFRSNRIGDLLEYERANPTLPVDDNIRDFVRANPDTYPVLAMVPNPFEHVGRYSSNPEKSTGVEEHKSLMFEP